MKKLKAIVYHCDYCTKVSLSAGGMRLHEMACKQNPDNFTPCVFCINCKVKIYWETEDGDIYHSFENIKEVSDKFFSEYRERLEYHKVTEFTCAINSKKMYHNKVNRLSHENREEIKGRCDMQMPFKCPNFIEK